MERFGGRMTNKQELSKTQDEAVNHFKGPALVIAGPGAGKTFVITERVKNLITKRKIEAKKDSCYNFYW